MSEAYDAEQRRELERALREGVALACPACGAELSRQPVQRSPEVAYVRRRVWVVCPGCRRSASLDNRP
ncbi:MAG TPA: hypothetical protein VK936_08410 [Longimicrobiales bacterium]|nr:hypothetical protein [Longimicrobiales bacterium]